MRMDVPSVAATHGVPRSKAAFKPGCHHALPQRRPLRWVGIGMNSVVSFLRGMHGVHNYKTACNHGLHRVPKLQTLLSTLT